MPLITVGNLDALAAAVAYRQSIKDGSPWAGSYVGSHANSIVYQSLLRKQTDDSPYSFSAGGENFQLADGTSDVDASTMRVNFLGALVLPGLTTPLAE